MEHAVNRATDQMPDSVKAFLLPHAIVAIVFAALAVGCLCCCCCCVCYCRYRGRAKRAVGRRKVRRAQAREQKSKLIEERDDFDMEDDYDDDDDEYGGKLREAELSTMRL